MKITDKQRLDWLSRNGNVVTGHGRKFHHHSTTGMDPFKEWPLRKAIDAAIRTETRRGRR